MSEARGKTNTEANNEADTAYHEAGHVVIGFLYDRPPTSATIVRDGDNAGKTDFGPDIPVFARSYLDESPRKRAYTEARVVGELAGSTAHDLFRPGRQHDHANDLYWAKELISELVSWENAAKYLGFAQNKATELIQKHWRWVEAIANALMT